MKKNKKLKALILDIETSPLILMGWSIQGPQYFSLENILEDWSILSFSAKWLGEDKIYYEDTSKKKNPRDDKEVVKKLHKLMSEAHVIIGQNSDRFDIKKIKARVEYHKLKRLPKYQTVDTCKIARKEFGLTSNKLEYMCKYFKLPHKKLKARKFSGLKLWKACLNKVKESWEEMKQYNIRDVQATEDLYNVLAPYSTVNFDVYNDGTRPTCNCGSTRLQKRGFNYSSTGKHQRFQCLDCGSWMSETGKANNKLPKDKKLLKRL